MHKRPRSSSHPFISVEGFRFTASQIVRLELTTPADVPAGDHEHALAPVVNGLRILRRRCDMRFHDFPDEETVFRDPAPVLQPALEVGVTLAH